MKTTFNNFFAQFFTIVNISVQLCRTRHSTILFKNAIKIFPLKYSWNTALLQASAVQEIFPTDTVWTFPERGIQGIRRLSINELVYFYYECQESTARMKPTLRGEIWKCKPSVPLPSPQWHPSPVKTEFMSGINETKLSVTWLEIDGIIIIINAHSPGR